MGYTHYWYKKPTISRARWARILEDFKKVIPKFQDAGVGLAGANGEGEPIITEEAIVFNGDCNCGHPKNAEITIPWPTEYAQGVANPFTEDAQKGQWFGGAKIEKRVCNGDCSYETFALERSSKRIKGIDDKSDGKVFSCTKTAFRPYDWAVITILIIAKHHLGDKIRVESDGEIQNWADGMKLCLIELGYGMDFQFGREEKEAKKKEAEAVT